MPTAVEILAVYDVSGPSHFDVRVIEASADVWFEVLALRPETEWVVAALRRLPDEVARRLAESTDEDVRRHLAYRNRLPEDVQWKLARDVSERVRWSLARPGRRAPEVIAFLALDTSENVRCNALGVEPEWVVAAPYRRHTPTTRAGRPRTRAAREKGSSHAMPQGRQHPRHDETLRHRDRLLPRLPRRLARPRLAQQAHHPGMVTRTALPRPPACRPRR